MVAKCPGGVSPVRPRWWLLCPVPGAPPRGWQPPAAPLGPGAGARSCTRAVPGRSLHPGSGRRAGAVAAAELPAMAPLLPHHVQGCEHAGTRRGGAGPGLAQPPPGKRHQCSPRCAPAPAAAFSLPRQLGWPLGSPCHRTLSPLLSCPGALPSLQPPLVPQHQPLRPRDHTRPWGAPATGWEMQEAGRRGGLGPRRPLGDKSPVYEEEGR